MESKIIRSLVVLGIPGVALGVFYLLLRSFNFQFSQVNATATTFIAVLFLLVVSGITLFALHRFSPNNEGERQATHKSFEFRMGEEVVTYNEKLISLQFDVVEIVAHSHIAGVASEYAWIAQKYPESKSLSQGLTTLELITGTGKYSPRERHFDAIKIVLKSGREKCVYFDISAFFDGETSSHVALDSHRAKKISELYGVSNPSPNKSA